jgi:hypothetical protein
MRRPTPPIGYRGVSPSQGRSSMASHLVQPVRPLPTACLLPFLLRPPQDRGGHDGRRCRWGLPAERRICPVRP